MPMPIMVLTTIRISIPMLILLVVRISIGLLGGGFPPISFRSPGPISGGWFRSEKIGSGTHVAPAFIMLERAGMLHSWGHRSLELGLGFGVWGLGFGRLHMQTREKREETPMIFEGGLVIIVWGCGRNASNPY